MNGPMAAVAVLAAVAGVLVFTMRNHVKGGGAEAKGKRTAACERAAAVIFAVAAFCGLVAFAPRLAVLWQVTGAGPGLVVLAAVLAVTGFFTFLGAFRGKGHHHHGTIAVSVTFAAALALAIGGWHQVTRSAGQGLASARHAAGGVVSGTAFAAPAGGHPHRAAAAAPAAGGHLVVIIALLLLAAAAIVFARGYRKATRAAAPRRTQAGGGQAAEAKAGGPARLAASPQTAKGAP
jgi:hypothetical protein